MPISSPNPMFDHLLELSRWDDSNKLSNIGFSKEIRRAVLIEIEYEGRSFNVITGILQGAQ